MRNLFPDTGLRIQWHHMMPPVIWAACMVFIFGLQFESFPRISFAGWLSLANMAHVIVFAIFTFLLAISFKKQYTVPFFRKQGVKISLISGLVYGTLMELFQLFIFEGRSFEWLDIGLNMLGSLTGVVLFHLVYRDVVTMG